MTRNKQMVRRLGLALLLLLASGSIILAQSYGLTSSPGVGGGGVLQTGDGSYTLTGSIAQANAGPALSDGGNYALNGGYWPASGGTTVVDPPPDNVYLPVIRRDP